MPHPRAVVIPFGVPHEARGLGLGLAALVHTFVQIEGGEVAVAQLHARGKDEPPSGPPLAIEAFVPPLAWRDIVARTEASNAMSLVLTGALEPPGGGRGAIQLLAFDAQSGQTRARVDATLDEAGAGASLLAAFEELGAGIGGEMGALRPLGELDWEPLESVLRAERCALHDPLRAGPHDRVAAMLHLGRAIGDAPRARFPVERLAALAVETAKQAPLDAKLASAAVRALTRAAEDAPTRVEIVEALAALELRLGKFREAERRVNAAIALAPTRTRLYALLSQALRAQGDLPGALAALQPVLAEAREDPTVCTEKGIVLAASGDLAGAQNAWREALARDPVHPGAFGHLGALALGQRDAQTAQTLVDIALATAQARPEVLRCAVQLALATEGEGIARASRLARLCNRLLESTPGDAWALLALARSSLVLGDIPAARSQLAQIDRMAPHSAAAAHGQVLRLSIEDPRTELELQSVLRAAEGASPEDLPSVASRARKLATVHGAWPGWLAAAVAERRLRHWTAAREALDVALEIAPGATAVHLELSEVLLATKVASGAIEHAERAVALEGESPRALALLARAFFASGRLGDARQATHRALAIQPDQEDARALAARLAEGSRKSGWGAKARGVWSRLVRG